MAQILPVSGRVAGKPDVIQVDITWGKLLGDVAAVSAMLDRLLHHGHVLKCGPRSWRTKSSSEGA